MLLAPKTAFHAVLFLRRVMSCSPNGHDLLVTRWLTVCSAYKSRQSFMVSHRAVDQLKHWDSSINMSHMIWLFETGALSSRHPSICLAFITVLDAIMDCQDWYEDLTALHLLINRLSSSTYCLIANNHASLLDRFRSFNTHCTEERYKAKKS